MSNHRRKLKASFRFSLLGLVVVLVSASSIDAITDEEQASHVLSLMRRASALEPPRTLPRHLRRRVSDREASWYESDYRNKPGILFFEYPLTKPVDSGLYRELKKLWKQRPADKLPAAPFLVEPYFEEQEPLKAIIFEYLTEITEGAFDVPNRSQVLEPVWLSMLRRAGSPEEQRAALGQLDKLYALSADAYVELLALAKESKSMDDETRAALIRTISSPWVDAKPPPEVESFLLTVASQDPCFDCRIAAVSYHQVQRLGSAAVLPAYLKILEDALLSGQNGIASRILLLVGVQCRLAEAAPGAIKALSASEPEVRAEAVNALEKIVGIPPEDVPQEFEVGDFFTPILLDDEDYQNLRRATETWTRWWIDEGEQLLRAHNVEEFKRKGQSVYKRHSVEATVPSRDAQ